MICNLSFSARLNSTSFDAGLPPLGFTPVAEGGVLEVAGAAGLAAVPEFSLLLPGGEGGVYNGLGVTGGRAVGAE